MEWISVKDRDRLPEHGEYVLVYNTEGAILKGKRAWNNDWIAHFIDGEFWMGELEPTHWMPLPEPPKQ